eukprot:3991396-Heterocapsa_arctica.AAC.1
MGSEFLFHFAREDAGLAVGEVVQKGHKNVVLLHDIAAPGFGRSSFCDTVSPSLRSAQAICVPHLL